MIQNHPFTVTVPSVVRHSELRARHSIRPRPGAYRRRVDPPTTSIDETTERSPKQGDNHLAQAIQK